MGDGIAVTRSIDRRRRLLMQAMSLGVFAGGLGWNPSLWASLFGRLPQKLPEGRSIFEISGDVRVNGEPATEATALGAGDRIETGPGGTLVAAVGGSAFLVRDQSRVTLAGASRLLVQGLQLVTGAVLSVFGPRNDRDALKMSTPTATIGIRGTGVYAEARPDRTYLCTCYGTTDLQAAANRQERESITASYHDQPRWILAEPDAGRRILPAPFINHTDQELMILEAIVGRTVPFGLPDSRYDAPRRDY